MSAEEWRKAPGLPGGVPATDHVLYACMPQPLALRALAVERVEHVAARVPPSSVSLMRAVRALVGCGQAQAAAIAIGTYAELPDELQAERHMAMATLRALGGGS